MNNIPSAVIDAIEKEFPGGVEESINGIIRVDVVDKYGNSVLYYVNATEDFWVVEGATGEGLFFREEQDALHEWGTQ